MSLPFFDALQMCFPQSRVDIIAKNSSIRTVFFHHPVIHTIYPFSKSHVKGVWNLFRYGKSLRRFGPYDLFISLPVSFSSALVGYGARSRIRAGYKAEGRSFLLTHRFSRPKNVHQVYSYLYLLQNLCQQLHKSGDPAYQTLHSPPGEAITHITFPFSQEEEETRLLERQEDVKYIVFNVNSEAPSRRLPLKTWSALGNKILNTIKAKLVLIGTPAEKSRVEEVMHTMTPQEHLIDFCGNASVRELAILLRDADLLVSNNSGPVHLANAVDTPVVTFGGAAGRFETEPFNQEKATIINKHLKCSPCWKNICKFPTVRCLEAITADEIYQSAMKLMRNA